MSESDNINSYCVEPANSVEKMDSTKNIALTNFSKFQFESAGCLNRFVRYMHTYMQGSALSSFKLYLIRSTRHKSDMRVEADGLLSWAI